MQEPLFSASWYRVAEMRPRLRSHARIHRHSYRGHTWFVLQDFSTGRFHRFTPAAYRVIGLMDGGRSVDEIWRLACEELGDDAPTQDGMVRLLAQLHQADVLQSDVTSDTAELFNRQERVRQGLIMRRFMSPFAVQIPLIDPERFLNRTVRFVRPLIGWWGFLLWLAVVVPAAVLAGLHLDELTEGMLDRLLTPQNLAVIWLLFPVIKLAHEFGHAYVAKAFGGEIHDMGIMLLVLTPVPYVEASSASAFRRRYQRVAVGSGGMLIELFLAALATYVWVAVQPGIVRTLAFNTMLIAGLTTLLFNANPLLRFDGYYILSDSIEIPNLRQRATAYLGYLLERYLLRNTSAEPPEASSGERAWLFCFGLASFVYRIAIVAMISFLVLNWSLVMGIVLLSISAIGWIVMPAVKGIKSLLSSPRLAGVRARAWLLVGGTCAALFFLIAILPLPLRTRAEGVIWIPDEAHVRAGADGFIQRVVATPGERVESGELLIECRDPALEARVRILEARVVGLEARHAEQRSQSVSEAQLVLEQLRVARQRLGRAREEAEAQIVRSASDGIFVAPRAADLPGRFVTKGQQLGDIVNLDRVTVRTVVPQDDIQLMNERLVGVQVRLAEQLDQVLPATVQRMVPAASDRLPSLALGSQGGGEIAVNPFAAGGGVALERLFEVELALPESPELLNVGGRVYVRFDLGSEPLASQWYRRLRQLFLARFNV